ncbi:hypothetical protein EDD21DRAFT_63962 [Dissophora ornata]|nr:hypothetical protein EDD21DRAFT_63962 [Dissophora ornata]
MKKVIQSIFERKSKYSETGSSSERNAPREGAYYEAVETGVDAYRDRSAIERDTGSNTLAGDLAMSVSLSPRPRPVNPLRPRINRDRSITVGESSRPHFYVNNHSSIEVDTTRGDCTRSVSEHVRPQGSHRDDSGVGDRSNTRRHSPLKVSEHRNSHDNNNDDSGSRPATGVRPQKSVYINGSVFQMYDPSSHCSTPPPVMYSPMPRTGGYESSEEDRRESSSFHAPVHQTRVSSTFGISSNASPTHPRIPSLNEFGGCNDHEYEDDVEGGQSGPESEGVAQGGRRFPTLRTALAVRKRNSNINEFSALSEFIPPPREKPNDPHWIKGESGRWFLQSCDPRKPPRHQSNRDSVVSGSILDADDCPKKLSRYNYDKQQYFDDHMQEVQGNLDPDKAKQELEQQAHRFAIMMRRTRRMASIGARAGDKFLITFERLQPHNSSEQEQECVTNQGDNYNYREASDTAVEDSDEREGALGKPRNQGGGVCRKPPLQPLLPPPGPLLQSVVFSSTHKSRSLQDIQARGLSSPAPRQQTRIPSSSPEPLPHGAASQPPRERNSMPARPSRNPSTSTPKRQSYGTSSSKGTAHRVYYEHDTEIKPTSRSSYLRNKSSTTTSITRMGARGIVVRGSSSEHQRELGSEYVEPTPPNALVIRPDRSGNGVVFLEGSSFGRERSTHATSTMTYVKGQEEIEKCTTDTNFIAAKRTTRSTLDGDAKLTSNPHTGSSKDRTGK